MHINQVSKVTISPPNTNAIGIYNILILFDSDVGEAIETRIPTYFPHAARWKATTISVCSSPEWMTLKTACVWISRRQTAIWALPRTAPKLPRLRG